MAIFHEPCGLPDESIGESVPLPFLPQMPSYLIPVPPDSKAISKLAQQWMTAFELAFVTKEVGDIEAVERVGYEAEFAVDGVAVHAAAMAAAGIAGALGIGSVVADLFVVVEKGGSVRTEVVCEPR